MRTYYLDSIEENGSLEILREHGILVSSSKRELNGHVDHAEDYSREHKTDVSIVYSGPLLIDIRDSAGCWLRCHLADSDSLHVPADVYRRLPECRTQPYVPLFRHSQPKDEQTFSPPHSTRELVCELCKQFFLAGWVTGAFP